MWDGNVLRPLRSSAKPCIDSMKRYSTHLLALLLACGEVCAQTPPETLYKTQATQRDAFMEAGMEVRGVRAPYYDVQGELKAQLYGGHAKMLEGGVADITNLRIDVFQDGEVAMTVFAPQCFTRINDDGGRKTLTVYSDGDVLVDMDEMTITGRGFNFASDSNRFEIQHDAKVLVREAARQMDGVEL